MFGKYNMKKVINVLIDDHSQISASLDELKVLLKEGSRESLKKIYEIFSFFEEFTSKEHHQREERVLYTWMLIQDKNSDSSLIRKIISEHEFFENKIKEIREAIRFIMNAGEEVTSISVFYEIELFIAKYEEHIEREETFIFEIADGLKISQEEVQNLVEKMNEIKVW